MPHASATSVVRGEPIIADLGGEIVPMSLETGTYDGLDAVGSDVGRRLETPIRVDVLCIALEEAYEAEAGAITPDVVSPLTDLLEHRPNTVAGH